MAQVVEEIAFNPESLCAELSERGHDFADKEAAYRALDDATKSVLGQAYLQTDGTVAEREAKARNTIGVLNHLEAVAKARKAAMTARINYEVYGEYIKLSQTRESTRRAEASIR